MSYICNLLTSSNIINGLSSTSTSNEDNIPDWLIDIGLNIVSEKDIFNSLEIIESNNHDTLSTTTTTSHPDIFEIALQDPTQRFLKHQQPQTTYQHPYPPIIIHVFAWRRSLSLQRLLKSLSNADYDTEDGFGKVNIELVIHVDGGSTKTVDQIVDEFVWPYGIKRVVRNNETLGLKQMMKHAWHPSKSQDHHLSLFLEDDIELSPLYFKYIKWCTKTFLSPTPLRNDIIGCSLYTPRVNEISPTDNPQEPVRWVPDYLFGSDEVKGGVFLLMLPCSWGGVYSGRWWRGFLEFFEWRVGTEEGGKFAMVPRGARSNYWEKSWKRYLIEYMYNNTLYMVYPSFPNQTSFSTNHYEEGVHSVPEGMEIVVSDRLREVVDERFTVPLLERRHEEMVWRVLPRGREDVVFGDRDFGDGDGDSHVRGKVIKKTRVVPVVDLFHEVVVAGGSGGGGSL
ncbi:hypothetical protein HDU76_008927 [Blyttiomyces sp. JEL0837]|nr:hypothetical protein HDU76_008927 [Blyttiomyces sp. JEL0837]